MEFSKKMGTVLGPKNRPSGNLSLPDSSCVGLLSAENGPDLRPQKWARNQAHETARKIAPGVAKGDPAVVLQFSASNKRKPGATTRLRLAVQGSKISLSSDLHRERENRHATIGLGEDVTETTQRAR